MSLERQAMRGRQAERKMHLMELTTEIAALSSSIRAYLAPDVAVSRHEYEQVHALETRYYKLQRERAELQTLYDATERELA